MDRSKPPKARRLPQRVRKTALTLFAAMLGMAPQTASPAQAFADTTGTASPQIVIFYGTGETVHGEWREDTLTIDGKPAYCVEVDSEFKPGIDVSPCDPVAEGIWSQDICTKLALIDQFVKSGNYVSTKKGTGDGHRVTDADEQYAVAQCYIWKFLNDAGYAKNHYGWFGAATVQGKDLTGSDTDDQIWEHVRKNIGQYRGSAKYYDCGGSQNLACSFSLSPIKGYISIKKRSADEDLTSKSGSYSLSGAQYGIFSSEECSENTLVATLETNDEGEAKSEALPAGNYFVKETRASAGFSIDP
ncbi:MAG: prealbumin-like fold domain-containing protein, partial [Eggerthellaceae bacterium]